MTSDPAATAIIVFDAKCVLCSATAQFVLRHDRAPLSPGVDAGPGRCRIAPAPRHRSADPDTIILVEGECLRRRSDAVPAVCAGCGWPRRAAAAFRIVPRVLRDPVYRLIARHRYRLFGRHETCRLPAPENRDRLM